MLLVLITNQGLIQNFVKGWLSDDHAHFWSLDMLHRQKKQHNIRKNSECTSSLFSEQVFFLLVE